MSPADQSTLRNDFDRIAQFSADDWNHNDHYHPFLLRYVPRECGEALDIGCGTGTFSRLLAARSRRVLALDLSPEMIRVARQCSAEFTNIEFRVADVSACDFQPQFDCIAVIATLHHLPLEETLCRLKGALRPGGVLLVLDLFEAMGLADRFWGALAVPVSLSLKMLKTHRWREPAALHSAWAEHGRNDSYPTLDQIRKTSARILPGARVTRHLLWRYSLIWQRSNCP